MHLSPVRLIGITLLSATMLLGAACSDDDDSGTDATSTPTSTATATPTTTPTTAPTEGTPTATPGGGAAAGGGIEAANPDSPPEGTLASEGGEVDLGLGSYCWSPPEGSGQPALCADAMGIITGVSDLVVLPGETLTIAGEAGTLSWPPMVIDTATLLPAPAEPIAAEADFRAWQPEGGFENGVDLESDSSEVGTHTITLPEDLESGRYLLSIFYTAGPDRGSDASYGAILVVE